MPRRSKLVGAQRPQLQNVPPYVSSAGAEAIELAKAAGLDLLPWQRNVLTDGLGEDAQGQWSAFECGLIVGRQSGKGSLLEARVLAGLNLFDERLILWSAHETKTAFEGFRRCEALFTNVDELRKQVKTIHRSNGSEGIELRNGARLRFVARTKGSGRGFSADLVILDEAYALTGEQMAALIPTLATRANPQIWYTSSPPLDGSETGEQLFALRERALANDPTLAWFDWGVQGVDLSDLDELDLDDRALWAASNPSLGHLIDETFIARERATLSTTDFARERLGIWPRRVGSGSGVVDPKLWAELADAGAPRPDDVTFAVDVNPQRTYAAILACGPRPDGTMQTSVIDYRPGTAWVVDRLADLRDRWKPLAIGLDAKGPAASLLLDLDRLGIRPPEDPERPKRGDLAVPNASQVAQAFGLYLDAIRQKQLRHLDEAPLNLALAGAKTRALAGGSAWDRKADTDICPLVASTLAHWAYVTRAHLARAADYDLLASVY